MGEDRVGVRSWGIIVLDPGIIAVLQPDDHFLYEQLALFCVDCFALISLANFIAGDLDVAFKTKTWISVVPGRAVFTRPECIISLYTKVVISNLPLTAGRLSYFIVKVNL